MRIVQYASSFVAVLPRNFAETYTFLAKMVDYYSISAQLMDAPRQLDEDQFKTFERLVSIPSWRLDAEPERDERGVLEFIEEDLSATGVTLFRQEFMSREVSEVAVFKHSGDAGKAPDEIAVIPAKALYLSERTRAGNADDESERREQELINSFCTKPGFYAERRERFIPSWNLIAEKGNGTEFTVMIYVHVDTVVPASYTWKDAFKLQRDGGWLKGLGAYDMKAGVLAAMEVLKKVPIPNGMKLIVAFCPDEEGNSEGAQRLLELPALRTVDLVLSPEIATIYGRPEADGPQKDIIASRVGHAKMVAHVSVPQAHAFQKDILRAETAISELRCHLMEQFTAQGARMHEYFGEEVKEELHVQEVAVPRAPGFSNTTTGKLRLSQFTLPPNTLLGAIQAQSRCAQQLADMKEWLSKGIEYSITKDQEYTSYEPYVVPINNLAAGAVIEGVNKFYGGHKLKAGRSTSDMNVLVPWFVQSGRNVPCIEVGPVGRGAHSINEAVLEESLARNIAWYRFMMETQLAEYIDRQRSLKEKRFS
jgi:acetylornithine deacetylase/succinyl-diaminopimelate desuccinylase-like protein